MRTVRIFLCGYFSLLGLGIVSAQESSYQFASRQNVYEPTYRNDGQTMTVKNVILMVGDGMGLAHVSAAMHANGGDLAITRMRHIALLKTQSQNRYITDSAAAGTAYATGQKTANGCVGVDSLGNPLPNISEILSACGYAIGLVTTDRISGATPAAFYSHCLKRSLTDEILSDLIQTPALFVAGGSLALFENTDVARIDSLSINGFKVVYDYDSLPPIDTEKVALIADGDNAGRLKNNRDTAFLRCVTEYALEFLSHKSDTGFFLMVEGAQIDHAAHAGDVEGVVRETLDFDKAVAEALRFADRNGETLVIVLADHETGGMSLGAGNIAEGKVSASFSSTGHTPILVPLYAYGPCSNYFSGVIDNTEVFANILSVLNISGALEESVEED